MSGNRGLELAPGTTAMPWLRATLLDRCVSQRSPALRGTREVERVAHRHEPVSVRGRIRDEVLGGLHRFQDDVVKLLRPLTATRLDDPDAALARLAVPAHLVPAWLAFGAGLDLGQHPHRAIGPGHRAPGLTLPSANSPGLTTALKPPCQVLTQAGTAEECEPTQVPHDEPLRASRPIALGSRRSWSHEKKKMPGRLTVSRPDVAPTAGEVHSASCCVADPTCQKSGPNGMGAHWGLSGRA